MTQFTTLTEQTARDLIDLLRRDRANPRGGPARVGNIGQQGQVPVRWGKTSTTPAYPEYPSSGNVVGVSLGNYEPSPLYPGATAIKTFTAYSPPIYSSAICENDSIPTEGDIVRLVWRNGFWWISQEAASTLPTVILTNGTAHNGEASNTKDMKGGSPNLRGYVHYDNCYGDQSGVGLDMMATYASVVAGTHDETDPSFRLTQTGLYRFTHRLAAFYNIADSTFGSALWFTTDDTMVGAPQTTGAASAGTAHTHPLDIAYPEMFGARLAAVLNTRATGGGAWDVTDEMDYAYSDETIKSAMLEISSGYVHIEWTIWRNISDVNREFRLFCLPILRKHAYSSETGYIQYDFVEDSGYCEITRLADYTATQTLSY